MAGIAIVGGNGSGKSTFGKALADMLGYKHIDVEDYAFRDSAVPYTEPRPVSEMREMIFRDIQKHGDFVLSSVGGDMGEEINALYKTIVYIQVPLDVRMEQVKQGQSTDSATACWRAAICMRRSRNFLILSLCAH